MGGSTHAVLEVGGQPPKDFETIIRRYVAHSPTVHCSSGNQLRAAWNLLQILWTPVPDVEGYERSQDFPRVSQSTYALDHDGWVSSHCPEGAFGVAHPA